MRIGAALVVLAALGSSVACEQAIDVRNAAPRVTWVAVQPPDDGIAEVTLWVSDLDGDPVDVTAEWRVDGEGEVRRMVLAPGSHGRSGLTTGRALFDGNGQPHLLRWEVAGVPADRDLRLVFHPDDLGARGRTGVSPPFRLDEGFPLPVRLEEQEAPAR